MYRALLTLHRAVLNLQNEREKNPTQCPHKVILNVFCDRREEFNNPTTQLTFENDVHVCEVLGGQHVIAADQKYIEQYIPQQARKFDHKGPYQNIIFKECIIYLSLTTEEKIAVVALANSKKHAETSFYDQV